MLPFINCTVRCSSMFPCPRDSGCTQFWAASPSAREVLMLHSKVLEHPRLLHDALHELCWASKYRIYFSPANFEVYLKVPRAEIAKAPAWSGQLVAHAWLVAGCSLPAAAAERQGSVCPATVAPRPTLQTTFGSDMWITERGNKTSPNVERTSGMAAFKPSSVLHSACQAHIINF